MYMFTRKNIHLDNFRGAKIVHPTPLFLVPPPRKKLHPPPPNQAIFLNPPIPVEKRPIFGGLFYTEKTPNK